MKQFLLFSLLTLCTLPSLFGQEIPREQRTAEAATSLSAPQYDEASTFRTVSWDKSVVIDTLLPPIFSELCADTISVLIVDTPQIGFINGTNSFFDLQKLQRITLSEATGFTINEAIVAFAVADSTVSDREVRVTVYEDLGGDNPLGNFLGISDFLLVDQLATGGNFTTFRFSDPVRVNNASAVILGVELVDVYLDDRDSLDYVGNVAVFSTSDGCGDGNNAFEIFPTDEGNRYNSIQANYGLDLEFAIGAIIDRDPFVATRTPLADYGTTVSPNPATDDFRLTFARAGNQALTASLLSTDGRVLRTQAVNTAARTVRWSVADLPAGLYLYQVAGAKGVETGRVMVR